MPIRQDALENPLFWAFIASGTLGCHGGIGCGSESPPDIDFVDSLFGVATEAVEAWSNPFTGWCPGIFDESDGWVEDPSVVHLPLAGDVDLAIAFYPGEWHWSLARHGDDAAIDLGNVGPHWMQPAFRWAEAVTLAERARKATPLALALLLPQVWLTSGDDIETARRTVESAWAASALVSRESASTFAELWVAAAHQSDYHWWNEPGVGWVNDISWSTRHRERPADELRTLNHLLLEAMNTHSNG